MAQTYCDLELIIVDDGSDDNTAEVAAEICSGDGRARLVCKKHTGAAETFNRGIEESNGDLCCVLGSDDLWLPTKLEEQVRAYQDFPGHVLHTESSLIDVNGDIIYESDLLKELGGPGPDKFVERHAGEKYASFFTSSFFIPMDIFHRVGLFPKSICEDYYWAMKAALLHDVPFTLIPKHLIKNRTNPRSITGENIPAILEKAERIWLEVVGQMGDRLP